MHVSLFNYMKKVSSGSCEARSVSPVAQEESRIFIA